jgi:hypothetical protein
VAHVKKTYARLSRMPAKLSQPLENGIAAYALAAGAAGVATLALVTPAGATPVCKTLSAELSYTATFAFDPAHQPVAPFNIAQSFHTFSTLTSTGVNRGFFTRNLPGAEAVVSSKGLVADLAPGARVGPGGHFGKGRSYGLIFTFTPSSGATSQHHRGNLHFGQTNYFGFRFLIAGKAHYGWIRLEATIVKGGRTPSIDTKIKAYGYESSPNTPILAGSCSAVGESDRRDDATSSSGATASGANRTKNATPPASLGALALGAQAVPWRRW